MSVQVAAQDVLTRFAALGAGQQRRPEAVALVIKSGLAHLSRPELEDALELLNSATTGLSMMTDQERRGMQAGLQVLRPPSGAGNAALGFRIAQSGLQADSASPADVDTWAQISGRVSMVESDIVNQELDGFSAMYRGLEAMHHGYGAEKIESSELRKEIEDSVLDIVNQVVTSGLEEFRHDEPAATDGADGPVKQLGHALRADPSTFLLTTNLVVSSEGKRFFDHANGWAQGTSSGARQLRKSLKEHRGYAAHKSEEAWTTPASKLSAARRAKLIGFERSSITPVQIDLLKGHAEQAAASGDGAFAFRLAFAARATLAGIKEAGVESFESWTQDALTEKYKEISALCSAHMDAGVAAFKDKMQAWVNEDPKGFLANLDESSELAWRWTASFDMASPRIDLSPLADEARSKLEFQKLERHLVELDGLAARFDAFDGPPRQPHLQDLAHESAVAMAKSFTSTGPHETALRTKRNQLTAKVAGALIHEERRTFQEIRDRRTAPEEALSFLATDRLDAWIAGGGKSEVEPWAGHLRRAAFDSELPCPAAQKVWGQLNQLRADSHEQGWSMSSIIGATDADSLEEALKRVSFGDFPSADDFSAALEDAKRRGQSGHPIQAFRIANRVALALPSRGVTYPRDAEQKDVAEPTLAQRGLSQAAVSGLQGTARSIMQEYRVAAVVGEAKLAEECVAGSYLAPYHLDRMVAQAERNSNLDSSVVDQLRSLRDSTKQKRRTFEIDQHHRHIDTQADKIEPLKNLSAVTTDSMEQVINFVNAHDRLQFAGRAADEPEAPALSRAEELFATLPAVAKRLSDSAGETADLIAAQIQATPATLEGLSEGIKLSGSLRALRMLQNIGEESSDHDQPLQKAATVLLARARSLVDAGTIEKSDNALSTLRYLVPWEAKGAGLVSVRQEIEAFFTQD